MISLSIIIPVFNAAPTLQTLIRELYAAAGPDWEYEIILVNDGSGDGSGELCRSIIGEAPVACTYLELSRNFGEHNAVMAGLARATGKYAVVLDDDLQHPPAGISDLLDTLRTGNYDVVYGVFTQKHHSFLRNLGSRFHHLCARLLLHKPKGLYLSSFKIINRFLIDYLVSCRTPFPYIDGLILQATSRIGAVPVTHRPRTRGKSNYSIGRLLRLWLSMAVNYSLVPLRISTALGFLSACAGLLLGAYFLFEKLHNPGLPMGWASIIVAVTVLAGVQLFILGVAGEYIGRILLALNRTPQYLVRTSLAVPRPAGTSSPAVSSRPEK